MTLADYFIITQWFFTFYFFAMNLGYFGLNLIALVNIQKHMDIHSVSNIPGVYTDLEPPITLLVPAYNEEVTIVNSVRALLNLSYPHIDIIIVNDGSTDMTLEKLQQEFNLRMIPQVYNTRLTTQSVKRIFISQDYPNIRVIDKENGGKSDALNAGINAALTPLYCAVDADSILQTDSLDRILQPFIEDPNTVAVGGSVRVANGCEVNKGFVTKTGLPKNYLALFQVTEYLRAFLFGRLGWSPINGLLIVSGAFGMFHRETVVSVGGYKPDTIGEDMELIVRMHRKLRNQKKPYRITFVPDPICWTETPEDFSTLKKQRIRWQIGLAESLLSNLSLLFNRNSGVAGWLAMPYMLFFELVGPIIEFVGIVTVIVGFYFGYISYDIALLFFAVAVGFGILLSLVAVLLEEISFHLYSNPLYIFKLTACAVLENFGYRQLNSWWRMLAMVQLALNKKTSWGKMKRKGNRPVN